MIRVWQGQSLAELQCIGTAAQRSTQYERDSIFWTQIYRDTRTVGVTCVSVPRRRRPRSLTQECGERCLANVCVRAICSSPIPSSPRASDCRGTRGSQCGGSCWGESSSRALEYSSRGVTRARASRHSAFGSHSSRQREAAAVTAVEAEQIRKLTCTTVEALEA